MRPSSNHHVDEERSSLASGTYQDVLCITNTPPYLWALCEAIAHLRFHAQVFCLWPRQSGFLYGLEMSLCHVRRRKNRWGKQWKRPVETNYICSLPVGNQYYLSTRGLLFTLLTTREPCTFYQRRRQRRLEFVKREEGSLFRSIKAEPIPPRHPLYREGNSSYEPDNLF